MNYIEQQLLGYSQYPWFPQFVSNFLNDHKNIDIDYSGTLLSAAFTWSHTPEGDEFWRDINGELESAVPPPLPLTSADAKAILQSQFSPEEYPEYYI